MSKPKVNFFRYAMVEFPKPNNPHILVTAWVENIKKFSIHMNDSVVVGHSNGRDSNGGMTTVRIIRRTNTLPKDIHGFITHTANQFPISDAPVQPELPVVSFPTVADWSKKKKEMHELIKTLEDTIIKIRMTL